MAVEGAEMDFDTWISERFRALNTDDEVFGPYIKSIVEGDETMEEKIDALDGILGELGESLDVEAFRKEILSRWESHRNAVKLSSAGGGDGDSNGIDSRLESILKLTETSSSREEDNNEKGLPKALGQAPDKALRAAILNQYRDDSDIDSGEDGPSTSRATREREGGGGGFGGGGGGLERNTNSERVQSELKDKREREKAESAKKREKDREDRANQKKQAQERKEKAKKKATKVERKSGR